jgi:tRNA-modifying protein YgfZ
MLIELTDRKIISLSGEDKITFLQGLITNDIKDIEQKDLIFAAFLTPNGRFFADFFLFFKDKKIYIDINEKFQADLIKKLNLYKLASDVEIKQEKLKTYYSDKKNKDSYQDPRNQEIGFRIYSDSETTNSDLESYKKLLIDNKIIDGAYDLEQDKSIILEFGYNEFKAIDFNKGCYLGQELITRTHRLGEIRKKIYKLEFELKEGQKISIGDRIFFADKRIGKLCSYYQEKDKITALALLKISEYPNLKIAEIEIDKLRVY